MSKREKTIWLIIALLLCAYWSFGLFAIAGYYANPIEYQRQLEFNQIVNIAKLATPEKLRIAYGFTDTIFLITGLILLILLTSSKRQLVLILAYFSTLGFIILSLLYGWIGTISFVITWIIDTPDGEWLSEHWPTTEALGLIVILACAVSIRYTKSYNEPDT